MFERDDGMLCFKCGLSAPTGCSVRNTEYGRTLIISNDDYIASDTLGTNYLGL